MRQFRSNGGHGRKLPVALQLLKAQGRLVRFDPILKLFKLLRLHPAVHVHRIRYTSVYGVEFPFHA